MSLKLKGIVFDKDGTLVDYAATWDPINRAAADFASRGDRCLASKFLEVGGYDGETGRVRGGSLLAAGHTGEIAEAWIAAGSAYNLAALTTGLDALFTEGAAGSVPVTDLKSLFFRLRRCGLALGVATSDSEAGARATLATIGLADEPLFVAGYDSGHGSKPEPGMVAAFCRARSLDPAQVAVVGDNLHDIRMGRAAGCRFCVGVLSGTASRSELSAEADTIIESVAGLETLFDRMDLWPEAAVA